MLKGRSLVGFGKRSNLIDCVRRGGVFLTAGDQNGYEAKVKDFIDQVFHKLG